MSQRDRLMRLEIELGEEIQLGGQSLIIMKLTREIMRVLVTTDKKIGQTSFSILQKPIKTTTTVEVLMIIQKYQKL